MECVLAGEVPRTSTRLLGRLSCRGDPDSGGPTLEDCPQIGQSARPHHRKGGVGPIPSPIHSTPQDALC